ncbi:hypothetical protein EKO04_001405 [Ascochyta lentis]|uniref:Uncharacterized protein n=1 Tax=Ascochyta lentis TaxID=205686 RepID=A0A8H7JCU2_9PLEO|nr:hypothetical protein EKO04_001405 [Ascochyta lentis]
MHATKAFSAKELQDRKERNEDAIEMEAILALWDRQVEQAQNKRLVQRPSTPHRRQPNNSTLINNDTPIPTRPSALTITNDNTPLQAHPTIPDISSLLQRWDSLSWLDIVLELLAAERKEVAATIGATLTFSIVTILLLWAF